MCLVGIWVLVPSVNADIVGPTVTNPGVAIPTMTVPQPIPSSLAATTATPPIQVGSGDCLPKICNTRDHNTPLKYYQRGWIVKPHSALSEI